MIWRSSRHLRIVYSADFLTSLLSFVVAFLTYRIFGLLIPSYFDSQLSFSIPLLVLAIVVSLFTVIIFDFYKAYSYQRFTALLTEYGIIFKVTFIILLLISLIFFLFQIVAFPRALVLFVYFSSIILFIIQKTILYYIAAFIRKKGKDRKSVIIIETSIGIAELIKFVNNSFHGLKVVFANEIGRICKALNINSQELMELFIKDEVLNISPYYFRPGFSYGGSCLPKDLKALNSISRTFNLSIPVLSSIDLSNRVHLEYVIEKIVTEGRRNIGLSGLSFKSGTDDLRFSPALELAERLIGKGFALKIYDENVHLSRLLGKNKEFLFSKLPHINEILCESLDSFMTGIELLVINNRDQAIFRHASMLQNDNLKILDLSGISPGMIEKANYEGICW